jgi:RHS repeat-associated protein
MGNVAFVLDGNGVGFEKYSYDAFGKVTITDWAGNVRTTSQYGNRFMFTGREYLTEIGIYDYRHRFYQPELGRFLQSDPKGFDAGDMNLFRYCADDPVNRTDPDGTIDSWSRLMWWQSGSSLSLPQFDALKQLQAAGGQASASLMNSLRKLFGYDNKEKATVKPNHITRTAGRAWPEKGKNGAVIVHVPWRLQLRDQAGKPLRGVYLVDEEISRSNARDFDPNVDTKKGSFLTDEYGGVNDPWSLPFKSRDGQVTTTQTMKVETGRARWDATVRASDPEGGDNYVPSSQLYAPFEYH